MIKIRARYPLALLAMGLGYMLWLDASSLPQTQYASIEKAPKLAPGYYVVLHTHAKLPADIPATVTKNHSYIGPLPTIKACHEMRNRTKPLYPGVMNDLIKISDQEEKS